MLSVWVREQVYEPLVKGFNAVIALLAGPELEMLMPSGVDERTSR